MQDSQTADPSGQDPSNTNSTPDSSTTPPVQPTPPLTDEQPPPVPSPVSPTDTIVQSPDLTEPPPAPSPTSPPQASDNNAVPASVPTDTTAVNPIQIPTEQSEPVTPVPQDYTPVPPQDTQISPPPTPESPATKKKFTLPSIPIHNKLFIAVGGLVVFLFLFGLGFATYVLVLTPKINTVKFVKDFKPKVITLKTSFKSVTDSVTQLHQMATEEIKFNETQQPVQTSQKIQYNSLAFADSNPEILGIQTQRNHFLTIATLLFFAQKLKNTTDSFIENDQNIAGTQISSENVMVEQLRKLKDQTTNTSTNILKTEEEITQLTSLTTGPGINMPQPVKSQLASFAQVQTVSTPYFAEVKKILQYYQTLSDTLITMNTKIASFNLAITSALSPFSGFNSQTSSLESVKSSISQSQVFLTQAESDSTEIKQLSENLSSISSASLPAGSKDFNDHNIKVFTAVTDYFTTETNVIKGYLTALNRLVTKSQTTEVTSGDLRSFQIVVIEGAQTAQKADTKFISDLQSLFTEEHTLAVSFWQNNPVVTDGTRVDKEIQDYDKKLAILIEQNKVPFLQ